MKYIRKRNGNKIPFDAEKIVNAIVKAYDEKDNYLHSKEKFLECAKKISKEAEQTDIDTVEGFQDFVERSLMQERYFNTAKKYIRYRYLHEQSRQAKDTDDIILSLIHQQNKELNEENSNKDVAVNSTQRDYIAGIVSKDLSQRQLLPKHIVDAHNEGILHFHDMDYFIQPMMNCCLINIKDMLDNGTVMNGKMIESPKSFRVACTVMTQIVSVVASNQYGGQSVDIKHLGKYLKRSYNKAYKKEYDYFKKKFNSFLDEEMISKLADEKAKEFRAKELTAGIQTVQYQINTLMTTNGQAPFVTLFLNLEENDEYEEEVALIIEEILKQRLEGIKNEFGVYVTPAFPKLIYVLHEHNCLKGGKYDYLTKKAIECSAKRMYPDYISAKKMKENYEGNVFSPMGCRSFLAPYKEENGNYKFEGRFNQGVVSINLPQISLYADGDEKVFWEELDKRLELCFEALMCRHKALKGITSDVSPIHWQYGAISRLKKGEKIDKLLYGGYSSISLGYIGLYEMAKIMTGESHTGVKGKEFALKVIKYLRKKCDEWKKETNIGFALYGTPAESLCYRFAKIDKEKYGDIEDITDKGYYTNSYHIDVREKIDIFSKFSFESEFQPISSGGCISYAEIPNITKNIKALEDVVRFAYENIQYFEFNTKSDYCGNCGFDGEIIVNENNQWECPQCHCTDKKMLTVTRRTCGYLGENFWNEGKTKEISKRVTHL